MPARKPAWRVALTWGVSLLGAVLLGGLASLRIRLWPDAVPIPRPDMLALAVGLFVPYLWLRAHRLAFVVDGLSRAAGGPARYDRRVLWGSGWVSFLVVLILPLRLGELSRPILLARAQRLGVGLAESLGAIAAERVLDGLAVCGLLFLGLAFSHPGGLEDPSLVRGPGRVAAGLFVLALLGLAVASRHPEPMERALAALVGRLRPQLGPRVAAATDRLMGAVRLATAGRSGAGLVLATAAYWGLATVYPWALARACGLDLGPWETAVVVGVIGLAIQLPGGPAQVGSYHFGAAMALGLFLPDPGGSAVAAFVALSYLVQLFGTAAAALPGLWLLARARRGHSATRPAPAAGGPGAPSTTP